jgi:hypothetical protein
MFDPKDDPELQAVLSKGPLGIGSFSFSLPHTNKSVKKA